MKPNHKLALVMRMGRKLKGWIVCATAAVSFAAGSLLTAGLMHPSQVRADGNRVFELMVYHTVPGKVPALESIFRDVSKLQAKHNLDVVGYWVPNNDPAWANTFIYLVAHPSLDEAKKNWHALHADPAFSQYREEAVPLIEKVNEEFHVDEVYMRPTDFSAMKWRPSSTKCDVCKASATTGERHRMRELRNCALVCLLLIIPAGAPRSTPPNTWIATWAASPQPTAPDPDEPLLNIEDQTVRERVRVSIGGAQIRIRLSNEYGSAPLLVGSATVGMPTDPASVRPGSIQGVTFGGRNSVTMPVGALVISDPVAFPVARGTEISISLYFPKRVATPTMHSLALKRAVVSQHGDHTRAEKTEGGAESESLIVVSAVLVPAQPSQRLVVALGDSVTDGDRSTVEADRTWPSDLIRRLGKRPEGAKIAVVNEGIVGNRLLDDCFLANAGCFGVSALARFDRDALALPGVTHIVLLEGINDIGFPGAKLGGSYLADPADVRTADELIGAYRQLISRAHAHGVKLIGATIAPFEEVVVPGYYSESKEKVRQAVNKWIRTSGAFDGVIDFDAVLRDPDHPSRLLPRFASKDHLHPNDLGYQAMADAIDVSLFK